MHVLPTTFMELARMLSEHTSEQTIPPTRIPPEFMTMETPQTLITDAKKEERFILKK